MHYVKCLVTGFYKNMMLYTVLKVAELTAFSGELPINANNWSIIWYEADVVLSCVTVCSMERPCLADRRLLK